jgi:hypothetical protein
MAYKKLTTAVTMVIALLLVAGGAAAALGVSFTDVRSVSFGEVEYRQSDLTTKGATAIGPGTTVEQLEIVVDNPASGNPTATVEVWLLSGDTEVTTGTVTESFTPGETTVTITLEDKVRESSYDSLDIRITEN